MARRRKRGISAAFSRVSKSASNVSKKIGRFKRRRMRHGGPKGDYRVTHDPFSYSSDPSGYRKKLRQRLGRGK